MPSIHVRDVPEPVAAALRERARRHGRSMQKEILRILEDAATEPLPGRELPPLRLTTVLVGPSSPWSRREIYGDEGR